MAGKEQDFAEGLNSSEPKPQIANRNSKIPWYLLPGMGADTRLFGPLMAVAPGPDYRVLELPRPAAAQSLTEYARLVAHFWIPEGPFNLLGVSFGGMLAVEVAKLRRPERLVVVSSAKTADEIPPYYRLAGPELQLPDFNLPWSSLPGQGLARLFGTRNQEQVRLFSDMLSRTPQDTLRWATRAVLRWRNQTVPTSTLHLHGGADTILPPAFVRHARIAPGAGHLLIYQRPGWVAQHIGLMPRPKKWQPAARKSLRLR